MVTKQGIITYLQQKVNQMKIEILELVQEEQEESDVTCPGVWFRFGGGYELLITAHEYQYAGISAEINKLHSFNTDCEQEKYLKKDCKMIKAYLKLYKLEQQYHFSNELD